MNVWIIVAMTFATSFAFMAFLLAAVNEAKIKKLTKRLDELEK